VSTVVVVLFFSFLPSSLPATTATSTCNSSIAMSAAPDLSLPSYQSCRRQQFSFPFPFSFPGRFDRPTDPTDPFSLIKQCHSHRETSGALVVVRCIGQIINCDMNYSMFAALFRHVMCSNSRSKVKATTGQKRKEKRPDQTRPDRTSYLGGLH